MKFSVIIPTCNRPELLAKCLDRVKPGMQTISAEAYEVIVTDDSADSQTEAMIREKYPWVIYTKGPRKGPAANRNHGSKSAKTPWFVFVDDDCIPENSLLSEYAKAIELNPETNAFEGKIVAVGEKRSYLDETPLNLYGDKFWSCNICVDRELFHQLNGFDENYPYAAMEDVDLYKRIIEKNNCCFVPLAIVSHPWRKNRNLFRTILNRNRSEEYYLKKFPNKVSSFSPLKYLKAYYSFTKSNISNLGNFGLRDLGTKMICDLLQVYFFMKALKRKNKKHNA